MWLFFLIQHLKCVLGKVAYQLVEHGEQLCGALTAAIVGLALAQRTQGVYGMLVQSQGIIIVALERSARVLGVRGVEAQQEVRSRAEKRAISQTVEALGVVGAPPLGLRYLRMAGRDTPTASASSCMLTDLPWELLPFMR